MRFHSLPGSKRYADTADEYATVLERHNMVLTELLSGPSLVVITCAWTDHSTPPASRGSLLTRLDPTGVHWCTIRPDPDDDPDLHWHLFASSWSWQPGIIDDLLCAVADDELRNIIIGPVGLGWLYHPYDGGADVILASIHERDELRNRHQAWLSAHPSGL